MYGLDNIKARAAYCSVDYNAYAWL